MNCYNGKVVGQITILWLLLASCTSQKNELSGTYQSVDPNPIKKAWKYVFEGYDGFLTGTKLELKPDSSFQMVTCANILTGKWSHTGDSLHLTYQTNRWRNDSLQEFGLDGQWPQLMEDATESAEINGNRLVMRAVSSKEDGGTKLYHVLEK